uniref:Uncharacterized protein n=1 Tax=Octopus bimaculoides TaxID=37653 RepID=A0A0L8FVJ8_OCTBM
MTFKFKYLNIIASARSVFLKFNESTSNKCLLASILTLSFTKQSILPFSRVVTKHGSHTASILRAFNSQSFQIISITWQDRIMHTDFFQ